MKNREVRNFELVELRADEADDEDRTPVITGQAAVYNSESVDLGGFTEVIEPGFFENVLEGDTRALFNHDGNFILGRTVSDTLRVFDHDGGLGFQVEVPDTQTIRDLVLIPMKRGDLDQCSFAFTVGKNGDAWEEQDDGKWLRTLKRGGCEELYDVSIVTYPAYEQTSAQARARFDELIGEADPGGPAAHGSADETEGEEAPVGDSLRKQKIYLLKAQVMR